MTSSMVPNSHQTMSQMTTKIVGPFSTIIVQQPATMTTQPIAGEFAQGGRQQATIPQTAVETDFSPSNLPLPKFLSHARHSPRKYRNDHSIRKSTNHRLHKKSIKQTTTKTYQRRGNSWNRHPPRTPMNNPDKTSSFETKKKIDESAIEIGKPKPFPFKKMSYCKPAYKTSKIRRNYRIFVSNLSKNADDFAFKEFIQSKLNIQKPSDLYCQNLGIGSFDNKEKLGIGIIEFSKKYYLKTCIKESGRWIFLGKYLKFESDQNCEKLRKYIEGLNRGFHLEFNAFGKPMVYERSYEKKDSLVQIEGRREKKDVYDYDFFRNSKTRKRRTNKINDVRREEKWVQKGKNHSHQTIDLTNVKENPKKSVIKPLIPDPSIPKAPKRGRRSNDDEMPVCESKPPETMPLNEEKIIVKSKGKCAPKRGQRCNDDAMQICEVKPPEMKPLIEQDIIVNPSWAWPSTYEPIINEIREQFSKIKIEADPTMVLNKLNHHFERKNDFVFHPSLVENAKIYWEQKISAWSLYAQTRSIQNEKILVETRRNIEVNILKIAYNNKENYNIKKKPNFFASTDIRLKSKEEQDRARLNVEREKEEYERKKMRDEQKKIRKFKKKLRPNTFIKKIPYAQKLITNNRY